MSLVYGIDTTDCAELLGREHEADDGREQRDAFDERGEDQGAALDRVGCLRLPGDALTGGAAYLADAETCTNAGQTGSEASADAPTWVLGDELGEFISECLGGRLGGGILEESEHGFSVTDVG